MDTLIMKNCPNCGEKIVFFAEEGTLLVTCPACNKKSVYSNGVIFLLADSNRIGTISINNEEKKKIQTSIMKEEKQQADINELIGRHAEKKEIHNVISRRKIHKQRKSLTNFFIVTGVFLFLLVIAGVLYPNVIYPNIHTHSWIEASCENPKTCALCGKTEGSSLGHSWADETVVTPKTCTRCGIKLPMTLPKSGEVFIGSWKTTASKLTISTANTACYVKLKNSSGVDVFSFFVRSNDNRTVDVPSGKYYVYFACGKDWYGPRDCFGESTSYSKDDEIADFSNYTYSYTLYETANGNFKETPIDKEEFD